MRIVGVHRASSHTLYLYALCIWDLTHIGIGVAVLRRDRTDRWNWVYIMRLDFNFGKKEVSHAA